MLAADPHAKTILVAQAQELMLQHVRLAQEGTAVVPLAATVLQVALTLAALVTAQMAVLLVQVA